MLNDAIDNLRELATGFETGRPRHNDEIYGALVSIKKPALTMEILDLTIQVPNDSTPEGANADVFAELAKLDAIYARLMEVGKYDSAGEIKKIADEVRATIANDAP
jgi:hypothetical protein